MVSPSYQRGRLKKTTAASVQVKFAALFARSNVSSSKLFPLLNKSSFNLGNSKKNGIKMSGKRFIWLSQGTSQIWKKLF